MGKKNTTISRSKHTLTVSTRAITKFMVLAANTSIEWSGYGPLLRRNNGDYILEDFYYLSEDDSGTDTTLKPEALAKAWMEVSKGEYDLEEVQLAWVHCHPQGMNSWSRTDETAIRGLTERLGKDTVQISVLYYGEGRVTARVDSIGKSRADMNVIVDYGEYEDDVNRAIAVEKESASSYGRDTLLLPEYGHLYPGLSYKYGKASKPPWESDDSQVTWIFKCELCMKRVKQNTKPTTCIMCGAKVCESCTDKRYPTVCMVDGAGLEYIEEAAELGPIGICYLCDSATIGGELYCERCKPIFENV